MSEDRKQLRNLAERATPGPWELQTSNSWRRIGTAGGRFTNGDVLAPTTHRGDNHPDLAARQEDLDFIVAADPATVLALLNEIDRLADALHGASSEVHGLAAQHGRDSAELRRLCQARDDYRKERDQLKAENAELRRDAEFFRFIEDCPIRTGVVLGRLAHEEGFDLRAECERVMALVAKRKAMTKEQP